MIKYDEVAAITDIIAKLIDKKFDERAEAKNLISYKVGTVVSYDTSTQKATLLFPSNSTQVSIPYPNFTGSTLVPGDKVYLFHKYNTESQGWILAKV